MIDDDLEAATMRCASITFFKEGHEKVADPKFDYLITPPDLMIEFMNQPDLTETGYELPLDLDNEDGDDYWSQKVADYGRFGVSLLWIVDLTKEVVHVYRQPEWKSVSLKGDDILDAGDVLPGFRFKTRRIFDAEWLEDKYRHVEDLPAAFDQD